MRREQIAQAVALAGLGRLGEAEEQIGDARVEPGCLDAPTSAAVVCIRVSPVPPDFEIATKRVVASGSLREQRAEGRRDRGCP